MPDLVELTQLVGEMMLGLKTVVDQVQDLTNIIQTTQTAGATTAPRIPKGLKDTIARPKAWTGTGGSTEARHFLAAYCNWASSQGEGLNDYDAVRNIFIVNEKRWISAVLNLMEEGARTWALPYLEELGRGKQPFKGDWAEFEKAREALKNIKQGKQTVAEYTSKFDQYTMQTGWSDADHRTRYYDGLSDKVKDSMAIMDQPISTFEELRKVALILDQRIRQREAEKKGQTSSNTSQGTSSRNPDVMEVDASRQGNNSNEKKTHKSYLATMKGRCFGCGSKEHNKKDGNHERDVCHHCGKAGHRSTVCLSKYLGKPPAAKAAATETSTSGPNSNGPSTSSKAVATSTPAKDNKTQTDLLAQLLERVKKQDEEIKALKSSF